MRWRWLWVVVALMVCAWPAGAESERVKASAHGGIVKVQIGKDSRVYYQATVLKPVEMTVTGPTRLRVMARHMAPEADPNPVVLQVFIGNAPPKTMSIRAVSSRTASAAGGPVGARVDRSFNIPEGRHRVRIVPMEAGTAAAVRIYRGTAKKAKVTWVPFAPMNYEKALRVRSGDTESTCYRFTAAKAVEMPIIGPLRMRVSTRVDFGMTNGTTQSYVVKVLLDGKPWRSIPLKARASHTVTYPDLPDVTPGGARSFELEVPAGRHRVSVLLNGTGEGAATAAVRVVRR